MNHIRLLIRNQCGSHIIHGIPNPLAFQQNYSRYDGPSESGSFFTLSKPSLTLFLPLSHHQGSGCIRAILGACLKHKKYEAKLCIINKGEVRTISLFSLSCLSLQGSRLQRVRV